PVYRIEDIPPPAPHKSIIVLKRLNFYQDGLLRQYRYFKYNYTDVYMFSLLRTEVEVTELELAHQDILIRYFHGA
ncbi:MAG: GNAT family protein, partial [Pseudomonadota bacterium]|nr:GNAT family protein [Pseudomonadota bacterium]